MWPSYSDNEHVLHHVIRYNIQALGALNSTRLPRSLSQLTTNRDLCLKKNPKIEQWIAEVMKIYKFRWVTNLKRAIHAILQWLVLWKLQLQSPLDYPRRWTLPIPKSRVESHTLFKNQNLTFRFCPENKSQLFLFLLRRMLSTWPLITWAAGVMYADEQTNTASDFPPVEPLFARCCLSLYCAPPSQHPCYSALDSICGCTFHPSEISKDNTTNPIRRWLVQGERQSMFL